MPSDPLEYWEYKHKNGHTVTMANPSGYEPDCPFCNSEVMKKIKESM